jgi:MoaA/NifB/PqqE/SkfB family radical SAM enzyme
MAREARELADRLGPSLERPRRDWRYWRRRARSIRTVVENYRTNRRRHHARSEELLPLYFIWTVLRTCNFYCTYCDDHRGQKYPDLPDDDVLSFDQATRLLRIMRTRTPSVYLAGGEPTLRKDLPEITRVARDLDYYPIIVNTNASVIDRLLAKERWRTWLADTDIIVVSVDSFDLRLLEAMWGWKRPHEVLRNLLLLRELAPKMRVKLMVNTVIQRGHIQEARDVLDFANDLGLWFCPVPRNIGPAVDHGLLDDPEYHALADLILRRKRDGYPFSGSMRMNRRLLLAKAMDCRSTLKPHIDYDGRLLWPCKASVNVEPVRINVLDFEDVDAMYAHASRLVNPTGFQGHGENQCGADCGWAQNYSTDAYVHGLDHPLALLGDLREFLQRT